MSKAPDSYLDCRRPPILEAIELEGGMTIGDAVDSLDRKGYFTPRPRPWKMGHKDRGLGRVDFAVLDRFGDLVVEVENRADAELIVSAVNAVADKVTGYVIQNAEGSFLTAGYLWYNHDSPEKARVHSEITINSIRNMSEGWEIKPTQKILAHYSISSGVKIFGKPEPF